MLTQMEVFTPGITTPPLPIVDQDAALDPIQITNIDGLGPVKASINTTQYGSVDGEFYNGGYTPKRNIVLSIKLNPNWASQSIEGLRQVLYSYFMPETQVRLRFTSTHLPPVEIIGYVESCEPEMFARDPDYQVSIICPNPYFLAVDMTIQQGSTQAIPNPVDLLISYEGSVDVGFVLSVSMPSGGSATTGEVRLVNNTGLVKLAIVTPVTIDSTKYLAISSVQSDKWVRQYPIPTGAAPTNLLSKLQPGSSWVKLTRGVNKIQILSTTAGLDYAIQYYAQYGGL